MLSRLIDAIKKMLKARNTPQHPHEVYVSFYASNPDSLSITDDMRKHIQGCAECQAKLPGFRKTNDSFLQTISGTVVKSYDPQKSASDD